MKRVLLVQPSLNPPGGGNAVAAWMLQALRDVYRLEVLTWQPIDLDWINRHCGTSLHTDDFVPHAVPASLIRAMPPERFSMLKNYLLLRIARRLGATCDAIIGVNCEADLGARGIQYVHFPRYADPRLFGENLPRDPGQFRWYHRSSRLMRAYFQFSTLVTGYSVDRARRNLTLVNSDWTGRYYTMIHGTEPHTLYPPVSDDFPAIPWEERENGFVCVGRISSEKRLEMVIDILAAVRRRGHPIHLHVIGMRDRDSRYIDRIRDLQRRNGDWIDLRIDIPRAELTTLLSQHRYGIHGMRDEHFGIAVAEMVNAGCVVFAPSDGGQAEIIGDFDGLKYGAIDEAVDKIDQVLRDAAQQEAARAYLAQRRSRFSTQTFINEIRGVVADFIAQRSGTLIHPS